MARKDNKGRNNINKKDHQLNYTATDKNSVNSTNQSGIQGKNKTN